MEFSPIYLDLVRVCFTALRCHNLLPRAKPSGSVSHSASLSQFVVELSSYCAPLHFFVTVRPGTLKLLCPTALRCHNSSEDFNNKAIVSHCASLSQFVLVL